MFDILNDIPYNGIMVNDKKRYSCCIIGHRKIEENINLIEKFINLIEKENITIFNFGFYGEFNDLCYKVLLKLKIKYSQIKLVLYSLNNEVAYTFEEAEHIKQRYEKQNKFFPHKCFDEINYLEDIDETKFKFACVLRNKKLINESDYCLFYCRENYTLSNNRNSGTKIAYECAKEQNKNIILI